MRGKPGKQHGEREGGSTALTFFGVPGSILAGVTHHPIRLVPRSVFQHVIPEIHKETGHWLEFTPHPQVEAIKDPHQTTTLTAFGLHSHRSFHTAAGARALGTNAEVKSLTGR